LKISQIGWLAALLAVAAVVGAVGLSPRPADAVVVAAQKPCQSSGTANQAICNLTILDNNLTGSNVYTITLNGPAQFLQQLNPAIPIATVVNNMGQPVANCTATITSFSPTQIVVALSGAGCVNAPMANMPNTQNFVVVQELIAVTGNGTISQTVTGSGGTSGSVTVNAVGIPPFSLNVPATITKNCTAPGQAGEIPGTAVVGQTITCQVTVTYTTPPTTPQTLTIAVQGGTLTSPATVTCPAGQAVCTFTETIVLTPGGSVGLCPTSTTPANPTGNTTPVGSVNCLIPTQTITTNGVVFTPALTGIAQVIIVGGGFVQGDRFIIRCPTALNPGLTTGLTTPIPGPILGGNTPIAVGVLPSALICEAVFVTTNAAGMTVDQIVAPGTIEVSALAGTLVDLSGGLSTNLRIPCDSRQITIDDALTVSALNSCGGVRFGVLGLGVGFVELRARYEPARIAALAGIQERETAATVAFVAPLANLNLLLNPNPVGVGATGTATARSNRLTIFANELLINPQTGVPLTVSFGTTLNGTVFFTTSNAAVASFVAGLGIGDVATGIVPGTSAGIVVGGGSTASIRCGSVTPAIAQNVILSAASFGQFFGGCAEASVQYRGNAIGQTLITATFIADLPGAFGGPNTLQPSLVGAGITLTQQPALPGNVQALINALGVQATNTRALTLEVVQLAATTQRLVPGCNNVVAPANETVAQVIARVDPTSAVVSVFKQVPGTTQFQGAPGPASGNVPAGVANLANVNALDAIFICVNAAATYRIV
jgi:hypothetical protein